MILCNKVEETMSRKKLLFIHLCLKLKNQPLLRVRKASYTPHPTSPRDLTRQASSPRCEVEDLSEVTCWSGVCVLLPTSFPGSSLFLPRESTLGFGWSCVSLKQTTPHQGGLAFLQEAKGKAYANLFKLPRTQRNGSY